jgi:hypothetical protein
VNGVLDKLAQQLRPHEMWWVGWLAYLSDA